MSVGRAAARGAVWAFASTAGARLITLVALALLARLLAPHEFGLLAFALVYITYAETIGDLGSGMALVYWPDRRDDAAQVTFVVNLVAGVSWCLLTLAIAPWVAAFFNAPDGAPLVRTLALSFVVKFLGTTHDALAQRDLRFRAHFMPDIGLATVKAAVSLVLAWRGYGAWSLVWGHLAGVTCRTVLLWAAVPWRPSLRLPFDLVRPMLAYGRGIIAVNVLAAITHHADLAVVGRVLGTTALGLYQMASKIPETTVVVLLWVFSRVLFPAFSRLQAAGESLRGPYLVATRYVAAMTMPAAAGLFLLARPIVLAFFGPKWAGAAPILAVLALYTALRSLSTHAGDVLKATGRANLLARLSVLKALLIVPALIVGARYGVVEVAIGLAVSAALSTAISLVIVSRLLRTRLRDLAASFAPAVAAAAAMAVPVLLWLRWSGELPAAVQAIGGVVIGALTYITVLALIDRELIASARRHLFGGESLSRTA